MSNDQLSMYWGPHHLWGQGDRGQGGRKLKLAPLTPRSLPLLQLSLSLLQLGSACSSSLPAHSQWPMYVWGSPPPLGGARGQGGSELERTWEWAGVNWSELEQAGVSLSEPNVILGPWVPGASGSPQLAPLAPSSLPSLPACSRDPGMLWEQGELSMYLGPYHLLGARG